MSISESFRFDRNDLGRPSGRDEVAEVKIGKKIGTEERTAVAVIASAYVLFADLRDFEVIHGVSRIVKLIPDKLNLALVIRRENLPDPKDDGSFFVVLVIDLLEKYIGMIREGSGLRVDHGDGRKNFLDCLQLLKKLLIMFNQNLKESDVAEQLNEAVVEDVLHLSGDIQILCQIYLTFIHPVLLITSPEDEAVQQIKTTAEAKLKNVGGRILLEEFKQLKHEY